jgi:hypothetical protein
MLLHQQFLGSPKPIHLFFRQRRFRSFHSISRSRRGGGPAWHQRTHLVFSAACFPIGTPEINKSWLNPRLETG